MLKKVYCIFLAVILTVLFCSCEYLPQYSSYLANIGQYENTAYSVVHDNIPEFTEDDYTTDSFEYYSRLDMYDRCGYAMACVGQNLMPTEDRKSISHIKPTGWVNNSYDFIDGEYLYNRCHLIGFQLTGENDNEKNLITGTRYMNTEGMLPFENMVADYIKETNNHVLYRVTPVFKEDELVARGVQMEALSMEDDGAGICFNVFCYNVQPGVEIDYATGENRLASTVQQESLKGEQSYILNTNSKKFHLAECNKADSIGSSNKSEFTGDRQDLIDQGYTPAGCCDP